MEDVYELFQRGMRLLEAGDFDQATVPLAKAAAIEPEKTSIREALGRAYFRSRRFEKAAAEFAGRRRARADERLRAVLPRPRADAERPPGRGAQAARARRVPAAGPARLPDLP